MPFVVTYGNHPRELNNVIVNTEKEIEGYKDNYSIVSFDIFNDRKENDDMNIENNKMHDVFDFDYIYNKGLEAVKRSNNKDAIEFNFCYISSLKWYDSNVDTLIYDINKYIDHLDSISKIDFDIYKNLKKSIRNKTEILNIEDANKIKINDKDIYSILFLEYIAYYIHSNKEKVKNEYGFKDIDTYLVYNQPLISKFEDYNDNIDCINYLMNVIKCFNIQTLYNNLDKNKYYFNANIYKIDDSVGPDSIMKIIKDYLINNIDTFYDPDYIYTKYLSTKNLFFKGRNIIDDYYNNNKSAIINIYNKNLKLINKDEIHNYKKTYKLNNKITLDDVFLSVKEYIIEKNNWFEDSYKRMHLSKFNDLIIRYLYEYITVTFEEYNYFRNKIMLNNSDETKKIEKRLNDRLMLIYKEYCKHAKELSPFLNRLINRITKETYFKNNKYYGNDGYYTIRYRKNMYITVLAFIKRILIIQSNKGIDVCKKYRISKNNVATLLMSSL